VSGVRTPEYLALISAVAFALATTALEVSAQTWNSIPPNPKVSYHYDQPGPEHSGIFEYLRARQVLEEYQRFLAPLRLPHSVRLVAAECDGGAFYSPPDRAIVICYDYVAGFEEHALHTPIQVDGVTITRQAAITGAVVSTLLHESGHMVFDFFQVPVFGREEDAADEMASFIALQFNQEVARIVVKGLAYKWTEEDPWHPWSDVHGSNAQRKYNALCLGYGGDAQTFREFVDHGWLPKVRAEHCGEEFSLLKHAFVKTVLPFLDQDLVARVQQTQWLTPEELK
jgi:hypothetical protein